jgi:ATP-dependent exoDNAse (exonuclease V) alpha subunit
MEAWIRNNDENLPDITRAKLYVAITRAKRSVAIVMDYQKGEKFEGIDEYIL